MRRSVFAVQALKAGQLETARAISPTQRPFLPSSRPVVWHQLGRAYLAAATPPAAAQVFRLVLPFATNDTIIHGTYPNFLVQAADGYAATDNPDAARDAPIQAQRIAVQAPDLVLPAALTFRRDRRVANRWMTPR